MNRVIHFEIHSEDPTRARKFYEDLFGWKFEGWGDESYFMITTGPEGTPGINGGLMKRLSPPPIDGQPMNGFVNVIEVGNVDEYSVKIPEAGGSLALPKIAIPGIGYSAYFKDTEGNIFGIYQDDKTAK
ncbi:MAG: glyoxalase [Treponema sp. GWB1_62_6]|nr:MAG: glyoxalase [Treponema sp. GWC1_61_84]OHE66100.1 MAG: glyoxalase [Treponema sp. GWB1_62_6]OHE66397.1 MAG: glyoxalase [Treponema sp. GWA1_62_8]OHE72573.1 MAG: glyoxalase [Treponema sp. RIFOXYC1_FULL_61_9]HCM28553.1 glyoxalase [Treponema sp.]